MGNKQTKSKKQESSFTKKHKTMTTPTSKAKSNSPSPTDKRDVLVLHNYREISLDFDYCIGGRLCLPSVMSTRQWRDDDIAAFLEIMGKDWKYRTEDVSRHSTSPFRISQKAWKIVDLKGKCEVCCEISLQPSFAYAHMESMMHNPLLS